MRTAEDMVAIRREILELLRRQMEVLDSPLELSESRLMECYDRQTRVQELREILQSALEPEAKPDASSQEFATAQISSLDIIAADFVAA